MQSIKDTYKDYLKNEYIKEKLYFGELVSVEELNQYAAQKLQETQFPIKTNTYAKDILDADSKSYNDLIWSIKTNFIVYTEVYEKLLKEISKDEIIFNNKINILEYKIKQLSDNISKILMRDNKTSGYFYTFYETLLNTDYININKTTATVDTNSTSVYIKPDTLQTINMLTIDESKLSTITYNTNNDILSNVYINNTKFQDVFYKDTTGFIYQVTKKTSTDTIVSFTFPLPSLDMYINAIEITANSNVSKTAQSISIKYSMDNNIYYDLTTNYYNLGSKYILNFDQIKANYIKLIIKKEEFDSYINGLYIYYFVINNIYIYNKSSKSIKDFYSNEIFTKDNKQFDFATIEVCDVTPDNSKIDYYLSIDNVNWTQIKPLNKKTDIVDIPYIFDVTNTQLTQYILQTQSQDETLYYKFKNTIDKFLQDIEDNIIYDTIVIYKNINTPELNKTDELYGFRIKDTGKVSTYFYTEADETLIPLGSLKSYNNNYIPIEAYIDGIKYNSDIYIPKGIHYIELNKEDAIELYNILLNKSKFIAATKMKRKTLIDYNNDIYNNDIFTLTSYKYNDEHKTSIIVREETETDYLIIANKILKDINSIFFKAVLTPSSNGVSPILKGYNIKFSNHVEI